MLRLFLIFLNLLSIIYCQDTQHLESPRLTNRGDWHGWARCPDGMYANGMQIKYEDEEARGGDNTGLNAIALYCQPLGYDGFSKDNWIMSGEGSFGFWQDIKYCPRGTVIIGFALRSEPDLGRYDNVGAENFAAYCGTPNGSRNADSWIQGNTFNMGKWTANRFCSEGYVVCGIQSQIKEDQRGGDNTSLNNVNVECCKVSQSS